MIKMNRVEAAQLLPSDSNDDQIRDRNVFNISRTEENVEAFVAEIEGEIYQVADSKVCVFVFHVFVRRTISIMEFLCIYSPNITV